MSARSKITKSFVGLPKHTFAPISRMLQHYYVQLHVVFISAYLAIFASSVHYVFIFIDLLKEPPYFIGTCTCREVELFFHF